MRRILFVMDRLEAWAAWCARLQDGGGRGLGMISSIYSGHERVQSASGPSIPVSFDPDAMRMDAIVRALADPYRLAILEVYIHHRQWPLAANARKLGISRATLHGRLCRADRLIDQQLREGISTNIRSSVNIHTFAREPSPDSPLR